MVFGKIRQTIKNNQINKLIKKGLKVGQNVHLGPEVIIDPSYCFLITIGDNVTLAPRVHLLAHDASMGVHLKRARMGEVKILNDTFIGAGTIILPGVTVGPNAVVGAGSVVTRDVPPGTVAAGNPAKVVLSLEEFLQKHQEGAAVLPYQEYSIQYLTAEKIEEIKDRLSKENCYLGSHK